jgi:hypothetical protein
MLEIIDKSIEKFETRKEMYKSKIDLDDYI